jgi:hypothetical protein
MGKIQEASDSDSLKQLRNSEFYMVQGEIN